MESRRSRLIIKAYLRGYLNENDNKYSLRSLARKEVILLALYDEEEAEITYRYSNALINLYGSHIQGADRIKKFANKQLELLDYSNNKFMLTSLEIQTSTKEELILNDPVTLKLINDFIYMRDNGIFDKIFNNT